MSLTLEFVPLYDKGMKAEDTEITVEHCSVLQEHLAKILDQAYPGQGIAEVAVNHMDPERMARELEKMFTADAFFKLFPSAMGKGVLIGAFVQEHILNQEDDDATQEG